MKKRLSAMLMILVLLLNLYPTLTVSAAETPTIVVDEATANPGGTVDVTIAVKNNPGIASMKLLVSYDAVLVLNSVVFNSAMGGMFQDPNMAKNPVTLNWLNGSADTTGDWVFATLTFTVAEDAAFGTYPITITYNPDDIYNIAETNLEFAIDNGGVTVACAHANKQYVEQVDIGCETAGYMEHYTCPDCGAILEADGVTETTMDHLRQEPLGHMGEEFMEVVKDPGCETAGTQKITTICRNCGEALSENTLPIEPTGHNYEAVVTEPTCTEQGYTTHTCAGCGDSYVDAYVDALDHSYVDGVCEHCGTAESAPQFPLGDVNMDGEVDTTDAYLIVQYYNELMDLTPKQLELADVDGNGEVDTTDAYWIVQYYNELIDKLPAEA